MSLNGIKKFQCITNMFLYYNKKYGGRDELYNVASSVAYYQIYVAYVSLIFFFLVLSFFFTTATCKQWLEHH
jgi:hypothetical protein